MARPLVDSAQGAQIIFVKSNWTGQYNSISHGDVSVGEIDTTHLLSTAKTNIAGDLIDASQITVDYNWTSDDPPPIGTIQNIILCNPPTGTFTGTAFTLNTSNNTFTQPGTLHAGFEVVSGFVKSYNKKYPADPAKMEGTMIIRLSGAISRWLASATQAG